jgi:enoyl-CoA hydratase
MDLVLTGRPVAAEELAHALTAFPATTMRQDRLSLLEQHGMPEDEAMANELRHGMVSLQADALDGAARFSAGAGRHGSFD